MRGQLVAVCGVDTRSVENLGRLNARWFSSMGYSVCETKQPTGHFSESVQTRYLSGVASGTRSLLGLALQSAADCLFHGDQVVEPHLARGELVLVQNYLYTARAYFRACGLELGWSKRGEPELRTPDLTIVMDTPIEACRTPWGIGSLTPSAEEPSGLEFLSRMRESLLELVEGRCLVVDGEMSLEEQWSFLRRRIGDFVSL